MNLPSTDNLLKQELIKISRFSLSYGGSANIRSKLLHDLRNLKASAL